ncbi:hypothetical protein ACN3E9_01310 [Vibrio pectenicida]|uniref:hypothetical protein n=1 Tax=Vibrio pectenicida TaxID=62763 RepID=UPI003B993742
MFNSRVVRIFSLSISIYFSSIVYGGLFDASASASEKVVFEETVEAISNGSSTFDDISKIQALIIGSNAETLGLEDYIEGDSIGLNYALRKRAELDELQQQEFDALKNLNKYDGVAYRALHVPEAGFELLKDKSRKSPFSLILGYNQHLFKQRVLVVGSLISRVSNTNTNTNLSKRIWSCLFSIKP